MSILLGKVHAAEICASRFDYDQLIPNNSKKKKKSLTTTTTTTTTTK